MPGVVASLDRSTEGTAQILADCGDIEAVELIYGGNLLSNGDFLQSTGVGATSVAGPGWTTTYTVPAGGNLFAGAGAGAATWAYFTTNAGQVTGNYPAAVPVQALSGRSMAVNVGPVLTTPVIQWANIFLESGATYAFELDAAAFNAPFSLAIRIDGNLIAPVTAPVAVSVWEKTRTTFTWTGTTGFHTVSMNSNSGAAGGNDHAFDNFALRRVFDANAEVRTPQIYDSRVRATVEQILEMVGCNDDRRDTLLADISNSFAAQAEALVEPTEIVARQVALTGAQTWTLANITAGRALTALSYTVIAGVAGTSVTVSGTTVSGLPTGFTGEWSSQDENFLTGVTNIAAGGAGGTVYVLWTERVL